MDSEAEVTGRYVVEFVESAGAVSPVFERKIRSLLEEKGIDDPQPDDWYRAESFVAAVEEVASSIGEKTIFEAGVQMGNAVPQPDGVTTPVEALRAVDESHQAAYRNARTQYPAGQFTFERLGDRTVRMGVTENWPYPKETMTGNLKGVVQSTANETAIVEISDAEPTGNELYAVEVSW